jgi:hypothetical protein
MTVGVDLSVQSKKTGVAWIDWSPSGARVHNLVDEAADELITRAVMEADKAGIDARPPRGLMPTLRRRPGCR